jgi:hypothetical protein
MYTGIVSIRETVVRADNEVSVDRLELKKAMS